jgi:hypothetical protein
MSNVCLQGYLCHPYLSLPYLDLLSDINVRGYLVGATNVLFKQKKQLADVLVEVGKPSRLLPVALFLFYNAAEESLIQISNHSVIK